MVFMKRWHYITGIFAALYLTGCANLQPVRDFANASAELSGYTQLTERFNTTYERERLYISGPLDVKAQANDSKRKAAHQDLLTVHKTATLYMQTLAKLAGEDTYDLSGEIKGIATGVKSHPDFGLTSAQVDAVANLSTLLTRWVTSGMQEKAVKEMVREGDASFQTLLDGSHLVRLYSKTNQNEKRAVLGFFEIELLYADTPKDKLLATLARVHEDAKRREYEQAQPMYLNTETGIRKVSEGHKELLKHLDDLSGDDLKASLKILTKDIKSATKSFQTLSAM
jgi:hypothetical protein